MVDWIHWIDIGLKVVPILISIVALSYSKKARESVEKDKQSIKISQELQMYSDIAYSNYWNWLPKDIGVNNREYHKYNEVIRRFVNYLELVDPKIHDAYRYVVSKFNSGYKDNETNDVRKNYLEIREYSKKKAMELGKQLREL